MENSLKELVLNLFDIKAVCFGEFTLKSGISSPIYIDLRLIVSYPKILKSVMHNMHQKVHQAGAKFDVVCGVPYTALPIATIFSEHHNVPMVMRRKEAKSYGLKKIIEGVYKEGQNCLVIEDLVTSGMSVFETIQPLEEAGLKVSDVVVLVDREQGGKLNIEKHGKRLHSVFTITEMLNLLLEEKRIDQVMFDKVRAFIQANQVVLNQQTEQKEQQKQEEKPKKSRLSYAERAELTSNKMSKELLLLMEKKKTNLCLSVDVTSTAELLKIADLVGPYICVLKTHVDILTDFTPQFVKDLVALAEKHQFILFEDRKFADIGSTVQQQYSKGVYKIVDWAQIVNCHVLPGEAIIKGLKEEAAKWTQSQSNAASRGLLVLAEMSSEGNLCTTSYTEAAVKMAEAHKDFVFGFISQHKLSSDPGLLYLTPGVQISEQSSSSGPVKGDNLGQQYNSPEYVIQNQGCDVIIVGRGILQHRKNDQALVDSASLYRKRGWEAYMGALSL